MLESGYYVGNVTDISRMSFEDFSRPNTVEEAQHNVDALNEESYNGVSVTSNWALLYSN